MSIREDILALVQQSGNIGITAGEIEVHPIGQKSYHGPVSGHLSNLHKRGEILRLVEKRTSFLNGKDRKFKIYVAPEHVNGRQTEPQGR